MEYHGAGAGDFGGDDLARLLVSWFVVRRTERRDGLSHYLATVSFLPQCVPSIVIGLAFIFVYVRFRSRFMGRSGLSPWR